MSEASDSAAGCGCGCGVLILIGISLFCVGYVKQCNEGLEAKKKDAAIEQEKQKVEQLKQQYLMQYNPKLKILRDKLSEELRACLSVIGNLQQMKLGFQREGSKQMVQDKINELKKIRDQLLTQFNHVDEEAEKGVALLSFNKIDGGGLASQDISHLLKDSQPILKLSQLARQKVASEMGLATSPVIERINDDTDKEPVDDKARVNTKDDSAGDLKSQQQDSIHVPQVQTFQNSSSHLSANINRDSREIAAQRDDVGTDQKISVALPVYETFRVGKLPDGFLNIRRSPSLISPVVAKIMRSANGIVRTGDIIRDDKDQIDWMPISFAGAEGYVSASFLIPSGEFTVKNNSRNSPDKFGLIAKAESEGLHLSEELRETTAGAQLNLPLADGAYQAFILITAGSYTIGSPPGEGGRSSDESQAEVRLSQPFWLAKTEVTQAQWEVVMGGNPSSFKGPNLPVESVSWADAQACITKLNEKRLLPEGWKFVLPTEAQWEYACRAGEKGPYSGGALNEVGWYKDNSGTRMHEVGQKNANAWGLQDMHGNVFEWCADWYADTFKGGIDPAGASSGKYRVCRGGAWDFAASFCRSAYRDRRNPDYRGSTLGFRLALVPSR